MSETGDKIREKKIGYSGPEEYGRVLSNLVDAVLDSRVSAQKTQEVATVASGA